MVFRDQFGPPNFIYRRLGLWGTVIKFIPAPLKVFGCISLAAAATVVLTPSLIILAAPPLIYGSWFLRRRNKYLSSVIAEMHNRRWQDMASFHLQPEPLSPNSQRIPTTAKVIVEKSLSLDDQGLRTQLGITDIDQLNFGPLTALSQDFRMGPTGGSEKMSVSEYPLLARGRSKGVVRVVSREGADQKNATILSRIMRHENPSRKTRIEVELTNGKLFILKGAGKNDDVIPGHGRQIS